MIHEFTSVFSTNLIYEGLPRKAFPRKQAKVDTGRLCVSVVAQAAAKIRPRPAQWLFSNERTWQDNWTHCSNECWMKVGEGWVCWVQVANMWQHCSLTAVQRKTAFVEESWWPEFNLSGSMPWCSFPWHKLLPRLTQNSCYTVYSLNLIHEFTSLFSTKVIFARLPGKPSHRNRPL